MTILIINKFHYLRGGSERHVFALSDLLQRKGHRVLHFSMKDKKNQPSKEKKYFVRQVDLHKFSLKNIFKYFYNFEAVKNLEKLLEENKVDIAHVHNVDGQIGPEIYKALKKKGIPIVQTLHDYKLLCPNAKLFCKSDICRACKGGGYYNALLNRCVHDSYLKSFLAMLESYINKTVLKRDKDINVFIAPSKFMKDISVSFGVDEARIEVINNFLDLKEEHLVFDSKEKDYLLYFGRLAEEKGLEVLIEAIKKLKSKTNFKIAGVGPELEKLQKKVKKLQLEDRVEFVGFKQKKELDDLIKEAKAVVMPSLWYENMPYSLLESLLSGKIVIVSKTGGMQEMINEGVNGLLFKRGDSDDLAEKIDSLDKIDKDKMKREAKLSIKDFGEEEFYEKLMKVYKSL